jgi:hypothetical protein
MASYMEELTAAWVGWLRHRNALQDKVISLIQKTDERFEDDEDRRRLELKQLQRSFYRVAIADKLLENPRWSSLPEAQLLDRAEKILDKRVYVPTIRGRPAEMRAPDEERLYGTVRVRWSNLLKKARVRPPDDRGGDTTQYRLR